MLNLRIISILGVIAVFVASSTNAFAETYVVTNASPGGIGSFAAAIDSANNHFGADLIEFDIPGSGPHYINPTPTLPLPAITDTVTIDGYSQPGAHQNFMLSTLGTDAAIEICVDGTMSGGAPGLVISADGCVVKGLSIVNCGAGILISGGSHNEIWGDFIGVYPDGLSVGPTVLGVRIANSSNNKVGDDLAYHRNLIGGNPDLTRFGVLVKDILSTGNEIKNTLFALDRTGIGNAGGFMFSAIGIDDAPDNVIGGVVYFGRNFITNSQGNGIWILNENAERNIVVNNYIGTDVTGNGSQPNQGSGVFIQNCDNNVIGGIDPDVGNLIRYNQHNGVTIVDSSNAIENQILGNSIYENSSTGIDLDDDGNTVNDNLDPDPGANLWQNYPECPISAYKVSSGSIWTSINGRLNSTPNTDFRVEFFDNDDRPYREGKDYLGYLDVTTDDWGNVVFAKVVYRTTVIPGDYITTTATDPFGNTSEFSTHGIVEVIRPVFFFKRPWDRSWGAGVWEFQVELINDGPGSAHDVSATLYDFPQGVSVLDGSCSYGDMIDGEGSLGATQDGYRLDLSEWTGGSFFCILDIVYLIEPSSNSSGATQHCVLPMLLEQPSATGIEPNRAVPEFRLAPNVPNPFRETTALFIDLPSEGHVTVSIYDVAGRLVKTLVDERRLAGPFQAVWDGRNQGGTDASSGVYFCKMSFEGVTLTRSLTLVR